MVSEEITPRERQEALLNVLHQVGSLNVSQAWEVGHRLGFYQGGDGSLAKSDLQALVQRNQARRTDGFWRHIGEPDSIRLKYKQWADYWTPR